MLHILTVHFMSPRWIDIQLDFIERTISVPYKTYANLEGIDEAAGRRFDVTVPAFGPHPGKLNYLAAIAMKDASDDDLLMFIDGDAFPIADPLPLIEKGLASTALVAVRRDENLGDVQPHPCFAVTSVGTWKDIQGDWSRGHPWTNEAGGLGSDVGGNLLYLLESRGLAWTPLLRSNRRNLHPIFFGVYADVVYHHGAGFRRATSRRDFSQNPFHEGTGFRRSASADSRPSRATRRVRNFMRSRWSKRRADENTSLSESVFARIRTDPEFFREICGVEPVSPARRSSG